MDYRKVLVIMNMWRTLPFYFMCKHCKFKEKVKKDLDR